jgi:hypothetical protein
VKLSRGKKSPRKGKGKNVEPKGREIKETLAEINAITQNKSGIISLG